MQMMDSLYLTSEGILKREANTIYFVNKDGKRALPIERITDIYCLGKVTLTSGVISYLLKYGVNVHFFNMYGYYEGSLFPRIRRVSGEVVIKQAEHYLNFNKRMYIAKEMVKGIKHNILNVLRYYRKKGRDVGEYLENIEKVDIESCEDIKTLMQREGQMWSWFYKSFNVFIQGFEMKKREYRPPADEINAMISFGNSLLYSSVLTEIYHTQLHPAISFLHEPSERRFSLALDLADIFKPVIVERVITNLVNNRIITEEDFMKEAKVFLNDSGKKKFLRAYNEKMRSTIYLQRLKRKVSHRELLRLECYKLIKHIIGDKRYKSYKARW